MQTSNLLRTLLLIALIFAGLRMQAQYPRGNGNFGGSLTGRLYGKAVDDLTGKPLPYASVQLRALTDSLPGKIVGGQLTQENGDFNLEGIPMQGKYLLTIAFMGYEKFEQEFRFSGSSEKDLGNLRMQPASAMLQEVTITGDASVFTLAMDKKVYKVDKDAIAAGGSAEDAMRNIPTLSVDIDGNVSLRNATPQIFVDGRPTPLTIDQIPADAVESIEVITNPSAKYDASGGGAGIVNIVLKKERKIGYNGSLNFGVDRFGRLNAGGDINAREGKFNAFLGASYRQRRSETIGETERQNLFSNPYTSILQKSNQESEGNFRSLRGGVDWFIDNRNTLTVSGSWFGGEFDNLENLNILTDSILPGSDLVIGSTSALRINETDRSWRSANAQMLFKHLFPKEGKEWTADLNLNRLRRGNGGEFTTTYPNSAYIQRQESDGGNIQLVAQTDFVDPITQNLKLEAGARAAVKRYDSDNANFEFDPGDNQFVRVPGFADEYEFDDQVYAAYASVTHSFTKWGYQAGLRAESSVYQGRLTDIDSTFKNEYPFSLFPSLFVTYKVNEEDNLQFSYTRRINRPSFFQIIPFPDFSDSLLLSRGNPGLIPEFTNALELSYQNIINRKHNYLITAYYRRATNLITTYQFAEYNDVLGREAIVSTFVNSNSSEALGLEFVLKNQFGDFFELVSNANLYNSRVNGQNVEQSLSVEQFTWTLKENLTLKLPRSINVQISGEYQSRTAFALDGGSRWGGWGGGANSTAQGYSIPFWRVDFSVRKDFWDRKGSISLNVSDVFRSRKTGAFSQSDFFIQENWRRRNPQFVRLNFSWRFGKFDASLFKRKNTRMESEGMDGGF